MIKIIDHTWIPMSDGSHLGARIWFPHDDIANSSGDQQVPAILEYIPYRKDDYSAARDSTTIAWFATRGYVCLRVDMRGSGSSDGRLDDEYSEQEIDDGVEVINWIAEQPWCDGNVGTIGISWGGITGLQMAQRQPDALKTVIALGATEFRYYDDGSYYMGCMTGQTIGWAAIMFGYNTRPPDPALVGGRWREMWLDRLNNTPHYLDHFLTHQREDEYWLRGTVGTDYDAINIPVYAVSGHADCWPNTVSRLLKKLDVPKRGLQGAWCHRYPHLGVPGPTIAFLPDAARWFDQWLKGIDTGIMDEATYQVFLQDSVRPKPFYEHRPGRWIGEQEWPSTQITDHVYHLGEPGLTDAPQVQQRLTISSPQTVGLAGGEYMPWFAFGPADELAHDQQVEDQGSLTLDTQQLEVALEIVGNAQLKVRLASNHTEGLLAVRLCDVWPDGASTLITRGIINLCQRKSKRTPAPLKAGEWYDVEVTLNHTAYTVPAGHKLRLACSTSYWPIAWPTCRKTTLTIDTAASQLLLPLRVADAQNNKLTEFESTELPEQLATSEISPFKQTRNITVDPESGQHVFEIDADNGRIRFENNQITMASSNLQRYSIHPDDPLSAKAEYEWIWEYSRGSQWQTKTFTRTVITCDEKFFFVETRLTAWEGEQEVSNVKTCKQYARDYF